MDDMTRMWKDHAAESQVRRRRNRTNSAAILRGHGIKFESKNDGAHLIVQGKNDQTIDFWPGTGKFMFRDGIRQGRGIKNLLKWCDIQKARNAKIRP